MPETFGFSGTASRFVVMLNALMVWNSVCMELPSACDDVDIFPGQAASSTQHLSSTC